MKDGWRGNSRATGGMWNGDEEEEEEAEEQSNWGGEMYVWMNGSGRKSGRGKKEGERESEWSKDRTTEGRSNSAAMVR